MAVGLYSFITFVILFANSVAIINERFLRSLGWHRPTADAPPTLQNRALVFLYQTQRCENNERIKQVREAYKQYMTPEIYHRVIQLQADDRDLQIADRAVSHYYRWTRRSLANSLPYSSQIYYHCAYQP